jgi:hypothetical protein
VEADKFKVFICGNLFFLLIITIGIRRFTKTDHSLQEVLFGSGKWKCFHESIVELLI